MTKKPVNLIYGLDDTPPVTTLILLGLQHSSIIFISMIFPVLLIREMGLGIESVTALSFISLSMIAAGITSICSTLKTVGDLVTCQKINDADWKRPDMKNISSGIFVDGLGGIIPGLIGGFGQSTSSANVGLSIASGATSKKIAYPSALSLFF
jgi:xanthine/uracil permease